MDIEVLPAICQLPGVDVVDHRAEGVGVHVVDVDLSFLLPSLQPSSEDWRLGAEEIFVNSECLRVWGLTVRVGSKNPTQFYPPGLIRF